MIYEYPEESPHFLPEEAIAYRMLSCAYPNGFDSGSYPALLAALEHPLMEGSCDVIAHAYNFDYQKVCHDRSQLSRKATEEQVHMMLDLLLPCGYDKLLDHTEPHPFLRPGVIRPIEHEPLLIQKMYLRLQSKFPDGFDIRSEEFAALYYAMCQELSEKDTRYTLALFGLDWYIYLYFIKQKSISKGKIEMLVQNLSE